MRLVYPGYPKRVLLHFLIFLYVLLLHCDPVIVAVIKKRLHLISVLALYFQMWMNVFPLLVMVMPHVAIQWEASHVAVIVATPALG